MILAAVLAAGVDWASWSSATLDRARHDGRPVFLVVAPEGDDPIPADDGVAAVLGGRYVPVRVDAEERPDVADLARLTLSVVSETTAPPDAPLWAVLTSSLHPVAAGTFTGVSAASLGQGLAAIADAYETRREDMEARAGIAAARLASSQATEPPEGPLTRADVERAVKSALQSTDRPPAGVLRLLRAEVLMTQSASARDALAAALDRLAASPEPRGLAPQALRLRALAEGASTLGLPSLSSATQRAAASLLAHARRGGAFVVGPDDGRVFAYASGLAVGALALSSTVLAAKEQRAAAAEAADAALALLGPWPSLVRCASTETRCASAYLEDYAFLAEGLLDLHDATGDSRWQVEARVAVDAAIARFLDSSAGGFFDTDSAHDPLPTRLKDAYDAARPSANGVMAQVLLRLTRDTGEKRYADLARRIVDAFRGDLQKAPRGLETLAAAADSMVPPPADVPVTRPRSAREVRGPITVEVSLSPDRVGPGVALEAHVRLTASAPWKVNGHHPSAGDLVPLTVSVPGDAFVVGIVRYPPETASAGPIDVVVPLRVARGVGDGPTSARFAVRFQACDGPRCAAPQSVILEAPVGVEAGAR